jgi:hypothetical protein
MRRLVRFILLLTAFLGGYYLGHRPGSPDIFAPARELYGRVADDDRSAVDAAVSYLREKLGGSSRRQDDPEDLWGYRRPTPRGQLRTRQTP